MHALATTKPPRPQQPNRRERRRKKQPRARLAETPTRPPDLRKCWPHGCCGARVPTYYTVRIRVRYGDYTPDQHADMGFDCYVHRVLSLPTMEQVEEREKRRRAGRDADPIIPTGGAGVVGYDRRTADGVILCEAYTTESASAQAAVHLEAQQYARAGAPHKKSRPMDDLYEHERFLKFETAEEELKKFALFRAYCTVRGMTKAERMDAQRRYLEIRNACAERRHWKLGRRLLAAEFPGWLERERT